MARARIPECRRSLETPRTACFEWNLDDFVRVSRMPSVARPRLLLVHGSVVNGEATWAAQRPLAERFELVVPNRRGFPPGPDVQSVDFEDEAMWLQQRVDPGPHLVGAPDRRGIGLLADARHLRPVR